MSVRPSIKHIIGIEGLSEDERWKFEELHEISFDDSLAERILPLIRDEDDEKEFVAEIIGDTILGEVLVVSQYDYLNFIGIQPIYHLAEAELDNHQLIWSMVEAGLIDMNPSLTKIPYEDVSGYLEKRYEETKRDLGLSKAVELKRYQGQWGRRYKHNTIESYDADLTLAKAFFASLGIHVEKDQIQRYIFMEWA
jgi:hypothetical protein